MTNIYRKKTAHIINCLIFFLFSILLIIPFVKSGNIFAHSDWGFHANRAEQLFLNLKRGHLFTYIATDTFNHSGSANFLFYPYVFLYPWAFLRFLFNPVIAFYLYIALMFFATMVVAYLCMFAWSKSKTRAFIFAILYNIVPYHLYLTIGNTVLGEAQAYTFLPLVIFGTFFLLEKSHIKMLACGLTLVGYCHIVSVVISLEATLAITILWLIFKHHTISVHLILRLLVNYIKSGIITLILSLGLITPFITEYHGLFRPQSMIGLLINFNQFTQNAISNQVTNSGGIGLILFITLFLGWYKNTSICDQSSYLLGILFSVISTNLFPWHFFNGSKITVVQFPYRYTSIASLFLSFVCSNLLINLISTANFKDTQKLFVPILTCCLMLSCFGSLVMPLERVQLPTTSAHILPKLKNNHKYKALSGLTDTNPKLLNVHNYNNQFDYGITWGETDYWPANAVQHRDYVYSNSGKLNVTPKANQMNYKIWSNGIAKTNLPCVAYKNTVTIVNGKKQSNQTTDGLASVHLRHGWNTISIKFVPPLSFMLSWIISLVGWVILILHTIYYDGLRTNASRQ